jgi:threonyl-tRNA synthetase
MLYLQDKQPFERIEVTRDQALKIFSDNKFKASILTLVSDISFIIFCTT